MNSEMQSRKGLQMDALSYLMAKQRAFATQMSNDHILLNLAKKIWLKQFNFFQLQWKLWDCWRDESRQHRNSYIRCCSFLLISAIVNKLLINLGKPPKNTKKNVTFDLLNSVKNGRVLGPPFFTQIFFPKMTFFEGLPYYYY